MIEEIHCITNEGKMANNKSKNDSNFLPTLYSVYRTLGKFLILFPYFTQCLNKYTSVLLQVINIWTS